MNKDFIPYEQALELKELGFDIPSISGYSYPDSDKLLTQAILYQQAFRWFREKHSYNCFIVSTKTGKWFYFREDLSDFKNDSEPELTPKFETYEEAELACLNRLIEIVINK